jgi:hypothetical protein
MSVNFRALAAITNHCSDLKSNEDENCVTSGDTCVNGVCCVSVTDSVTRLYAQHTNLQGLPLFRLYDYNGSLPINDLSADVTEIRYSVSLAHRCGI